MDPVNVQRNLKSVGLPFPQIIAIEVLVGDANLQSWGRVGRRGSGMVPFERALVISYRLSIVTFPLYAFQRYCRFCAPARTPLFPTPPLVSPELPHVPLRLGGWPLGYEEPRYWANCPCN